jgi:hypothetical protein
VTCASMQLRAMRVRYITSSRIRDIHQHCVNDIVWPVGQGPARAHKTISDQAAQTVRARATVATFATTGPCRAGCRRDGPNRPP